MVKEPYQDPKVLIKEKHKCPICGKLTDSLEYRPFCSKRCADIDLGNWFCESYVIEGNSTPEDSFEEE